jgi:hypothetical protein
MILPKERSTWVKNIVQLELNLVVSRDKGNFRRIQLITLDLDGLEITYRSSSITCFEKFGTVQEDGVGIM